jgi:hypothetical protein
MIEDQNRKGVQQDNRTEKGSNKTTVAPKETNKNRSGIL